MPTLQKVSCLLLAITLGPRSKPSDINYCQCSYHYRTYFIGPGTDDKSSPPVNPDAFITICNQYAVEATLSVGWTTTANGNKVRMPHSLRIFIFICYFREQI